MQKRLAMSHFSRRFVVSALLTLSTVAAFVLAARPRSLAASGEGFAEFACPSNAALTCVMDGLHNPRGITFGLRLPTRVVTPHVCRAYL
jgi:hypothetical protein